VVAFRFDGADDRVFRRDLDPGQRGAIRLRVNLASVKWQEENVQRQVDANKKRSEAAKSQPRSDKGFSAGGLSREKPPAPDWSHAHLATQAGASAVESSSGADCTVPG